MLESKKNISNPHLLLKKSTFIHLLLAVQAIFILNYISKVGTKTCRSVTISFIVKKLE